MIYILLILLYITIAINWFEYIYDRLDNAPRTESRFCLLEIILFVILVVYYL